MRIRRANVLQARLVHGPAGATVRGRGWGHAPRLRPLLDWLLRRKPQRELRAPAPIFPAWVYADDPLFSRGPTMAGDDLPDDGILVGEVNADLVWWPVQQQSYGFALELPSAAYEEERNDALLRIEWEKGEIARLAAEHQTEIANRKVA